MSNVEKKTGISAFDFFCIGFGAIVGVGWAVSINKWMASSGGPLPAAVGYVIVLIMMIPVALCYCELTPMLPVAGGGMAFAYKAFGEKVSFIAGWAVFGAFVTLIPWEAIYICDILTILFPVLKEGGPLYELAGEPVYLGHLIIGLVFSIFMFIINYRGATAAAGVQRVLTILLLGAGLLTMIVALIKFNWTNFEPLYENVRESSHDNFFGGAMAILATAPFFLSGFEAIPQAVEDASGDVKDVGKTVVLSVGLACVFYAALLFCLGGGLPWKEFITLPSPGASNAMNVMYPDQVGTALYTIILVGAICGLLTTWNSFMLASSRILMSLARANMVPKIFAKQHPVYKTPSNALIACFILAVAGPFLGMGLIDPLTTFAAAGFVVSWMITSFCAVRLRKTEPNMNRPYKMPGGTATGWFAGIVMAITLILLFVPGSPAYMSDIAVILFVVWMAVGVLAYLATAPQRNALPPEERAASLFATMKDK